MTFKACGTFCQLYISVPTTEQSFGIGKPANACNPFRLMLSRQYVSSLCHFTRRAPKLITVTGGVPYAETFIVVCLIGRLADGVSKTRHNSQDLILGRSNLCCWPYAQHYVMSSSPRNAITVFSWRYLRDLSSSWDSVIRFSCHNCEYCEEIPCISVTLWFFDRHLFRVRRAM